jgi:hypothetical protein
VKRRIVAIALVALAGSLSVPGAADAADGPALSVEVRMNGQETPGEQFALDPAVPVRIAITARNPGPTALRVTTVRISGTALGMPLFAVDTAVAIEVPAGGTVDQELAPDLADLRYQVTGLIPTQVELLDDDRRLLGTSGAIAAIDGSSMSVWALFGLAVLILTTASWQLVVRAIRRGRLPDNPWRRPALFLPPGFCAGLAAVLASGILGVFAPTLLVGVPMVLAVTATAAAVGYLFAFDLPVAEAVSVGDNEDALGGEVEAPPAPEVEPSLGPVGPAEVLNSHPLSAFVPPPGGTQ